MPAETERSRNIVFIVGVPRSGSTYLFQYLTHVLRVRYPDKLTNRLAKYHLSDLGFWLSGFYQRSNRGHGCFSSSYGASLSHNLSAPSEAGWLLNQAFPSGPQLREDAVLNDAALEALISTLIKASANTSYPLIVKNLDVCNWIDVLVNRLPDAKFIHIHRDPFYNAQSILLARRKRCITGLNDWSVVPREWVSTAYSDEYERVAHQVKELDAQIVGDLNQHVAQENVVDVAYETLVESPRLSVDQLKALFADLSERMSTSSPPAPINGNVVRLPDEQVRRLKSMLSSAM